MVIVDYIILIAFLISVVVGYFRGFFREALSLATWIVAIWLAWQFSWVVEPLFTGIESTALRVWAARLLTFIVILLLGGILGYLVAILVEKTGLSGTDRVLGMLFGVGRGVLVVGLVVMVLQLMELDREPWWDDAVVAPYGERIALWMRDILEDGLDELGDAIAPE